MQSLFYNNYSKSDVAFTGNLHTPEVHKAITLHPIKKPPYLYRLHNYLHSEKIADLRLKSIQHYREIRDMKILLNEDLDEPPTRKIDGEVRTLGLPSGLMKYSPDGYEEIIPWQFFAKYMYQGKSDSPRRGISKPIQAALDDIVMQVMSIINSNSMKIGRTIDYKEILYGYSRVVPQFGADYVLDLLLMYNKHKGKSRRLPVRRHAYLQQAFGKLEFRDDDYDADSLLNEGPSSGGYQNSLSLFRNKQNNVDSLMTKALLPSFTLSETIHFVLPLAGRFEIFQRFMQNFERTCLSPGEKVKLVVVLFKIPEDDPSEQIVSVVEGYQTKYPNAELKVLRAIGEFSRGLALDLGASQFPKDALLFFVDVDMYLTPGFLTRCRANTKRKEQVYYPIVFSQYNPDYVYGHEEDRTTSQLAVSKEAGFFRHYGFGIVCLYNADLSTVGGMDSSIIGWGMEDVDLYQKFVASNITVFRAPDPALVHIYHTVMCDTKLEAKQYQMCLGSKASTYGSSMQLAKDVEEIKKKEKAEEDIAEDPAKR